MSKKRTPAESNDDELSNEPLDVLQQDAKRAKLVPSSDTTLQDIPQELLEDILVKAVIMEVKGMRLAKSVWREKANVVIGRLGTVCLQWNSILGTIFLRNKVHEILDGTAQETFRLETLHQSPVELFVVSVATMKEEIFLLCRPRNQGPYINVHDRNNMAEVKDVIPLPGILPVNIAACNFSNCLYVLNFNRGSSCYSVLRITKDDEQLLFRISPWIGDLSLPYCHLSVAINGRLMILSRQETPKPSVVNIYNANGSLQSATTLFPDIYDFKYIYSVIQKSNGNLVLALRSVDDAFDPVLKEIDVIGRIIRQYRSSVFTDSVNVADAYGRIWISGMLDQVELLDSEFNLLDVTVPERGLSLFFLPYETHYNNERNEIACIYTSLQTDPPTDIQNSALHIFRFTGE